MTPTNPPVPPRRPGGGGGATYRHPGEQPPVQPAYHDGVHDHAMDDELHNADVAHEHTDINVRAIITSAIVLTAVAIVSHVIIWLLFGWFEQEAAANQPPPSPVARPATDMPPTTTGSPVFNPSAADRVPQLLTNEPAALEKHRAEEAKRLDGYGWVNQGAGIAHVPIDQAKKLIVERGLPARADAPVPPALGTRVPAAGEASGGRVITEPPPEAATPSDTQPPEPNPAEGTAQPAAKPH